MGRMCSLLLVPLYDHGAEPNMHSMQVLTSSSASLDLRCVPPSSMCGMPDIEAFRDRARWKALVAGWELLLRSIASDARRPWAIVKADWLYEEDIWEAGP